MARSLSKHWDDPEWREEQRKKWLERLPGMQAPRHGGSPLETFLHRALRKAGISLPSGRCSAAKSQTSYHQKPVVIERTSMRLQDEARERDTQRDADMRGR